MLKGTPMCCREEQSYRRFKGSILPFWSFYFFAVILKFWKGDFRHKALMEHSVWFARKTFFSGSSRHLLY